MQAQSRRPLSLGKEWPRALRNIWGQTFAFLAVATFQRSYPDVPGGYGRPLVGLRGGGYGLAVIFKRRTFCRYVCPVANHYKRNGTTTLFAALNVATGEVVANAMSGTATMSSWLSQKA